MPIPYPSLPTMPCVPVCFPTPGRFLLSPQLLTRVYAPQTGGSPGYNLLLHRSRMDFVFGRRSMPLSFRIGSPPRRVPLVRNDQERKSP